MKDITALILYCILAVTLAHSEWEAFKRQYERNYSNPTEELYRKKIFLNNKMAIDRHNQRYEEGQTSFTMGINQFADMTNQEFNEKMKNLTPRQKKVSDSGAFPDQENPISVDWRDSGCVGGAEDQSQCGSSWTFACVGVTEFENCQAKGKKVTCNEQNLIDCSWQYGNLGCNGGLMDVGFQIIIDHGLDAFPYLQTVELNSCQNFIGCTLSSYKDVTPIGSESALETAVATVGVIAAAIDASHASFQLYSSGVYNEPLCSSTQLDLGVIVVGYGVDGGTPYWLVQNGWGPSWGIKGYIEMSKDKGNQCGIATQASYGIY